MTKISRSPFMDEIEQAEPLREFSMPHFTSFKGDEDLERHLKCYQSIMILYRNNDDPICKIFATTLQGEAQDWFYTLRHNPSGISTNFLWFSPKNIHPIARSKRSLTIYSTSRRTQRSRFATM
ncbi:hypothetical protein ACFX2F_027693 [Malus domestica]